MFTVRGGKITGFQEFADLSEAGEIYRATPAKKGQGV
jgi:hypothetical protein